MKRIIRSLAAIVLVLTMLASTASALTVEQALELLESDYLRELPEEAYEAETLDELFQLLADPYTYYMSAEEYQAFLDSVEATVDLVGIGVSIQYTNEGILVVEPLKNGSAMEAGIQAGDLIVAVDGVSCVPADESHRAMIIGEAGTQVTVTVLRDGVSMDFVLTRAEVVVPNTEFEVLDGHIGLIECNSFGSDTGLLFLEAVETYNEAVDTWLVDLRSNSGGYTNTAVDALGVFAGAGYHLYLRDNEGLLYYYMYPSAASTEHPVILLLDEYSASASEAFAAGVRDYGVGLSVGSRTYGKGVAQIVYDETNCPGYFEGDALKLTSYRFYSANGITNDMMGVIPTLMVDSEMAPAVALALCGDPAATEDDVMLLELAGLQVPINMQTIAMDTLLALLEALPPSARLGIPLGEDEWLWTTAPEAAALMELTYDSRWFTDVEDSPFTYEINTLATYGMVHGDGNGNFYPGETLTRGEASAMLAKVLGMVGSDRQQFTDVPADDPYAPYINAMADMGMVVGMGDGTFRPGQELTRQEYYTILGRMVRYLNVNFDYAASEITQEQRDAVAELGFRAWSQDSVVLLGMVDALFSAGGEPAPGAPILREEAAASLCAVLVSAGILPG